MVRHLRAEIDIDATPERVWQTLTDFTAYQDWNPFMTSASGVATEGQRLTIRMQPEGGRAMTFRPTVLEATPGHRLRWIGRVLVPGIFDGEHSFTIEPRGASKVRVVQSEEFRGLLVPLMDTSLRRRTLPMFARMNEALKERAETV